MSPNLILFAGIATLAILAALGVVLFNNPIRSALCLVSTFLLLAVTYFTLKADMLGITEIVVYAGAIMVLFLFVIFLLAHSSNSAKAESKDAKKYVAGLLGIGFLVLIGYQVFQPLVSVDQPASPKAYGQPPAIGHALFTEFGYPLEAVSVLLLVGIVGSILLAKRRVR